MQEYSVKDVVKIRVALILAMGREVIMAQKRWWGWSWGLRRLRNTNEFSASTVLFCGELDLDVLVAVNTAKPGDLFLPSAFRWWLLGAVVIFSGSLVT